MAEHLSNETIDLYQQRRLSAQSRFQADMHLSGCPPCRRKIGEADRLHSLHASVQAELGFVAHAVSEHLGNDQIVSYLENTIDEVEREIITSHLVWCRSCGTDVNEMQTIVSQFRAGKEEQDSILARLRDRFRTQWEAQPIYWRVGSAFVAVVLVLAVPYVLWRLVLPINRGTEESVASMPQTIPAATAIGGTSARASASPDPAVAAPARGADNVSESPGNLNWLLADDRRLFDHARTHGVLDLPRIVTASPDRTMGAIEEESFRLLFPGNLVIRESQPTIRWEMLGGAPEYTVQIVDLDNGYEEVAKLKVANTEWKPDRPLIPGHQYRWQVRAEKNGKSIYGVWANQPFANFAIISSQELLRVAAAEERYKNLQHPLATIALAARYAKAGLVEDARRELKTIPKNNPHAALASRLLISLNRNTGHQ